MSKIIGRDMYECETIFDKYSFKLKAYCINCNEYKDRIVVARLSGKKSGNYNLVYLCKPCFYEYMNIRLGNKDLTRLKNPKEIFKIKNVKVITINE